MLWLLSGVDDSWSAVDLLDGTLALLGRKEKQIIRRHLHCSLVPERHMGSVGTVGLRGSSDVSTIRSNERMLVFRLLSLTDRRLVDVLEDILLGFSEGALGALVVVGHVDLRLIRCLALARRRCLQEDRGPTDNRSDHRAATTKPCGSRLITHKLSHDGRGCGSLPFGLGFSLLSELPYGKSKGQK